MGCKNKYRVVQEAKGQYYIQVKVFFLWFYILTERSGYGNKKLAIRRCKELNAMHVFKDKVVHPE